MSSNQAEELREFLKGVMVDRFSRYDTVDKLLDEMMPIIDQHTKEAERRGRHDAFEEIGAIGADYDDETEESMALHLTAINLYILEQRSKWAELSAPPPAALMEIERRMYEN